MNESSRKISQNLTSHQNVRHFISGDALKPVSTLTVIESDILMLSIWTEHVMITPIGLQLEGGITTIGSSHLTILTDFN